MKTSLPRLNRFALRLAVPLVVLAAITAFAALRPGWLGGRPLSLSQSSSLTRAQGTRAVAGLPRAVAGLPTEPPASTEGLHLSSGSVAKPALSDSPRGVESVTSDPRQSATDPPPPDAILSSAIDRLTYGPSLTARLHQRVRHGGGEVFGVGAYWQEAKDRGGRFKLELRTKTSHLRVVGDGTYVWRQAAIEGEHRVTRIDLKHFARLTGVQTANVQSPLDARVQDRRSVAPLTLGGLPQLLKSLAAYRFGEARPAILSDVPVFELRGELAANRPPATGASQTGGPPVEGASNEPTAAKPPPQIPSHVIVSLGQDDLFPYRVVYDWKNASPDDHESGVPTRVEILFFDVTQGPSIDPRHFDYSPPRDTGWEDVTAEIAAAAQPST